MQTIMPLPSEVQMFRWIISKLKKPVEDAGQIDAALPFPIDQSALADFVRRLREIDEEDTAAGAEEV